MDLLELLRIYLTSLRTPLIDGYLGRWPQVAPALDASSASSATSLPVLAYLPDLETNAPPATVKLVAALRRAAITLAWRQTYRAGELDAAFFANYAWAELLPPCPYDSQQQMTAGILLLGPHTVYPRHRHGPMEIYLPLSGHARWQQGDAVWRRHPPGSVIVHASDEPHAMQTVAEPLLAVYIWRDVDVAQSARLDRFTEELST